MFQNNYWSHVSPSGKSPWEFFKESGYNYSVAGENLAKDFGDSSSVVSAWMNSPTHKANIINNKYKEIGIGVVDGVLNGMKTTLVVQHFASPTPIAKVSEKILGNSGEVSSSGEITESSSITQKTESMEKIALPATPSINPLLFSKILGIMIFVSIIIVLSIDGYTSLKNKHHRLVGSNAGHIGFLFIILMFMIFSSSGTIF
jgi:hypothetical protein